MIGSVGAKSIREGLKGNATLKVLNLTGNQIGDEGIKILAPLFHRSVAAQILNMFRTHFIIL
jgi:hypothetical protein